MELLVVIAIIVSMLLVFQGNCFAGYREEANSRYSVMFMILCSQHASSRGAGQTAPAAVVLSQYLPAVLNGVFSRAGCWHTLGNCVLGGLNLHLWHGLAGGVLVSVVVLILLLRRQIASVGGAAKSTQQFYPDEKGHEDFLKSLDKYLETFDDRPIRSIIEREIINDLEHLSSTLGYLITSPNENVREARECHETIVEILCFLPIFNAAEGNVHQKNEVLCYLEQYIAHGQKKKKWDQRIAYLKKYYRLLQENRQDPESSG